MAEVQVQTFEPMRISKALARAGLCSRRDAERWIAEGRVKVNGRLLTSPALDVEAKDRIEVDGKPLPTPEAPQLWRYHKPRGLVTTHKDPEGRPTVFDALPPELPRVVSVGRLDYNTEGLLLLTNDGAMARHMELPATGWLRRYRVRAHGRITQEELDRLKEGIEIEGVRYGPIDATIDSVQGANVWLGIGLRGQEPRGAHDPVDTRARCEPTDPGLVRALPTTRLEAGHGRARQTAGAGRPVGDGARQGIGPHFRNRQGRRAAPSFA